MAARRLRRWRSWVIAGLPSLTPVTIVTGFLGSGKTTLIARLLRQPGLANTAVIVNEFGEVGLDHVLLERLDGDVVLLPQGCVCCMLNGTIADTLEGLDIRRTNGEIPPFDRVIVETTGLANPAPVLQTLLDRNVLLRGYTPGLVVTTVDAVHGVATLEHHAEAVQQVAMADRLLLTKPDLAAGAGLRDRLAALNPGAPVIPVLHGVIAPDELTREAATDLALLRRRASVARFAAMAGHARRIATLTVCLPQPAEFAVLANWLGDLVAVHGASLLRVKGIVQVRGQQRPLAVHGVQHVFHPPTRLAAWPAGLDVSTIVFILDGLDHGTILDSARAAGLRLETLAHHREIGHVA
jgi:G3E family GTPase